VLHHGNGDRLTVTNGVSGRIRVVDPAPSELSFVTVRVTVNGRRVAFRAVPGGSG
jgi:hypothetical protein